MNYITQDRALFASNCLMWLAIGFGALSFWSDPIAAAVAGAGAAEHAADWIVAIMLTVTLVSVSYLLSGSITRFAEAQEKGFAFTAVMVVVLGAILVLIEAGMTHQGLSWLNARKNLGPDWALWLASFGLSVFNVFSLYTFGRDLKKKEVASLGKQLADLRWNNKKAA